MARICLMHGTRREEGGDLQPDDVCNEIVRVFSVRPNLLLSLGKHVLCHVLGRLLQAGATPVTAWQARQINIVWMRSKEEDFSG